MKDDLTRLEKMLKVCIDVAEYRKAIRQNIAPMRIWPDDAQHLSGLLQELRSYRQQN